MAGLSCQELLLVEYWSHTELPDGPCAPAGPRPPTTYGVLQDGTMVPVESPGLTLAWEAYVSSPTPGLPMLTAHPVGADRAWETVL